MATSSERRIDGVDGVGGCRLAVFERGPSDAPTVLLVHGYPDDHAVWDLVAERLEADHHVVTFDVRGAGRSDAPSATSAYRMEVLVADIVAVARAVSPDRPVHLVGHDWGSIQSWSAVLDPTAAPTFASFTSLSGPGLDHVSRWVAQRRDAGPSGWAQLARQGLRSAYIPAIRSGVAGWVWRKRLGARWPDRMAREGAVVDDRWPGPNLVADAVQGAELYRANLGRRTASRGPGRAPTAVPVQLVVAAGDPFVGEALLEGIEDQARSLVRQSVDGGHWLPRSHPDDVARLIAAHIAAVESARPGPAPG